MAATMALASERGMHQLVSLNNNIETMIVKHHIPFITNTATSNMINIVRSTCNITVQPTNI